MMMQEPQFQITHHFINELYNTPEPAEENT